jgi:copper transport protein
VATEVIIAGLLLGVTASLTGTEPARAERDRLRHPPQATAPDGPLSRAVPFDAGGQNGKGQLVLVFAPAKVGPNELHLAVLDPGGGPKQVPELRAELRLPAASIGPIPVPLRAEGADRFSSPDHYLSPQVNLPMAGQWELALTVRTSEIDQTTVRIPVNAR